MSAVRAERGGPADAPPAERCVLAADVGGSKMLAARVDATGRVTALCRAPTPAAAGGPAVVAQLHALLQQACGEAAPLAIGLSLAGVIDAERVCVRDATAVMPGWKGQDLRAALGSFGVPVAARNDVHAALLGEAWLGGLRGRRDGALVTLGTGVGGAFLADGRLHAGSGGLAGHVGRTEVMDGDGRRTPLDALLSGPGLVRLHGGVADGPAFFARLVAGDAQAARALDAWLDQLALLLHNLHWLLDPGRVLVGGGLIETREHWWPQLQQRLAALPLEVLPAELGPQAGVLGAARIAWDTVAAAPAQRAAEGLA